MSDAGCVIFDLDGTLADTSSDLIGAANACFRALGHGDLLELMADRATAFAGGRAIERLAPEGVLEDFALLGLRVRALIGQGAWRAGSA